MDQGAVTLVNMEEIDGEWHETNKHTEHWFWRHPRENGVAYVPLKGDVRFHDVTFSYTPEKTILHDVSLFAKPVKKLPL